MACRISPVGLFLPGNRINSFMPKDADSKMNSGHTFVDNEAGLARIIEALHGTSRVGMDTEADSLHHYFEKVCLIQLSFLGAHYVVDPLAGLSLPKFFEVLSQKELIFQGADYDLRMLKKSFGFRPKAPVFDTMLAAQVLGYEKIGLAALVEKICGVLLPKGEQKADWSQRPLPARLLTYASDDTKYLEAIAAVQSEGLEKLGRMAWHRECCERVVKTSGLPDKNEAKEAWRIKGSSKAAPAALVFVQELWKWRDEEARRKDRPPFMILKNENMIELAEWRAKNPKVPLAEGPSFLKRFSGEIFSRLEKAVRIAEKTPASEWPVPSRRTAWPERVSEEKLEPLLAACKRLAAELKMESCFLASRAALTAAAQHQPESIERLMEVSGMMRWQAELMMPAVRRC